MKRVLITGGLGLVGVNYARHCLVRGDRVYILDNHARGLASELNAGWLRKFGKPIVIEESVADRQTIRRIFNDAGGLDLIVHLAAQSSVNKSMINPALDFESNVIGTFNMLDETRLQSPDATFLFFASNKVYDVTHWETARTNKKYVWPTRRVGPSEVFPFHTDAKEPYGASKIAGLYYARCYAAMYGLKTAIVVPSGMYGPRQFGRSAQGWLGWFVIATILGLPITIAGDGYQVRDMLNVTDVNNAIDMIEVQAGKFPGELFNLGGGVRNAPSLLEALELIKQNLGTSPKLEYADWRPQDNKVYISNCERLVGLGWFPSVSIERGVKEMCDWAVSELANLKKVYEGDLNAA